MYQSPFSTNEIKYFMNLMQNDNTEGKGATYAKLEILYALLYCILCYQFISDSTSKFLIFTSNRSCPSIWNILFQSIS